MKIGFKFQSLGKISNISAADPLGSFRSIPTLLVPDAEGQHNPRCRRRRIRHLMQRRRSCVFWRLEIYFMAWL